MSFLDSFRNSLIQMPGTQRLQKGDKVTHKNHPGVHVVYNSPIGDTVHIHPENPDFDPDVIRNPAGINDRNGKRILHRVRASELTKV